MKYIVQVQSNNSKSFFRNGEPLIILDLISLGVRYVNNFIGHTLRSNLDQCSQKKEIGFKLLNPILIGEHSKLSKLE